MVLAPLVGRHHKIRWGVPTFAGKTARASRFPRRPDVRGTPAFTGKTYLPFTSLPGESVGRLLSIFKPTAYLSKEGLPLTDRAVDDPGAVTRREESANGLEVAVGQQPTGGPEPWRIRT